MGLFEFLLVIVGIVLSLAVAELLTGVARMLRGDFVAGKLHILWVVMVFEWQVQLAWGLWGLRNRPEWRYPEFLLLLLGPVATYLAAVVLFPPNGHPEPADRYLMQHRRTFFLLTASYDVITEAYAWFLFADHPAAATVIRAIVLTLLITLAVTERRAIQWAFGLLLFAGHLAFTYQYAFVVAATPAGR